MEKNSFQNQSESQKSSVNIDELNSSQREAVTSTEVPCLLLLVQGVEKRELLYTELPICSNRE